MEKQKITIENLEYIIDKMRKAQNEHPKAIVYYDWETSEIRITYPLPKDYLEFRKRDAEGKDWFGEFNK